MYKVTVMYPNEEGVRFDFDYYRNKHMKLVAEQFRPFGLTKTGVEKGISGGGQVSPHPTCAWGICCSTVPMATMRV